MRQILIFLIALALAAPCFSQQEILLSCRNALASPSTLGVSVRALDTGRVFVLSQKLSSGDVSSYVTIPIPNAATSVAIQPLVEDISHNASLNLSVVKLEAGTYEAIIGQLTKNASDVSWVVIKHDQPPPSTDTALVRVAILDGVARSELNILGTVSECYQCAYKQLWTEAPTHHTFTVSTDYENTWEVRASNAPSLTLKATLVSGGEYTLLVSSDSLQLIVESADFTAYWLPLVIAAVTSVGLALLGLVLIKVVLRLSVFDPCLREKPQPLLSEDEIHEINVQASVSNRVAALDAFRGFTMTWMVFVNYGAGGYWFLDHAAWNGLHVADLLFPWFIFIMGTSMALSYKFLDRPGLINRGSILYKLIRRSIILVALGLFLNNMHNFPKARVFGVLQRFGVTYLVVGLIILFIPRVQRFVVSSSEEAPGVKRLFADFLPYMFQWLAVLAIVTIYLCVQFLLPVPGCPTGYIGPGGLADGSNHWNCTGGAHGYIDSLLVGVHHVYQHPTCQEVYQTGAYDPEGTLGFLTSVLMAFLGLQAGRILTVFQAPRERITRWAGWSVLCGVIALALSGGTQNGGAIPINKNLWSPSFVTATSSLGFFLLIVCYVLVDVTGIWSGAPFIFVGLNPILIYCCHGLFEQMFPFSFITDGSHAQELLSNLIGVTMWLIIAYRMHILKFYVRI